MHLHRRRTIDHAWDDYNMGYLARIKAERIELQMVRDQQHEREQLTDMKVITDCCRCGAPIEVPSLAYRGERRHACVDCAGAAHTGYAPFSESDEEGL